VSLTAILSGIVAIAKAVPVIANQLDKLSEMWITSQLSKYERDKVGLGYERRILMSKIQRCKDDKERKALSLILSRTIKL
jgi:hypothetical protein